MTVVYIEPTREGPHPSVATRFPFVPYVEVEQASASTASELVTLDGRVIRWGRFLRPRRQARCQFTLTAAEINTWRQWLADLREPVVGLAPTTDEPVAVWAILDEVRYTQRLPLTIATVDLLELVWLDAP